MHNREAIGNMAVTVKDVARRAQVSSATVSRVMNLDVRISPETSDRVRAAIRELGYSVNHLARALKTNRTHTVGLLVPEFRNDFFMGIAQGVEEVLRSEGWSLMICNSSESPDTETERLSLLMDKRVDGVIIIPASNRGDHYQKLAGVPMVLVDRLVDGFASDSVLVDNQGGTRRAMEAAVAEGARRIGFLGGDLRLTSAAERFDAYRQVLRDRGIEPDPSLEKFGDFHADSGFALMGELLSLPSPPDAVFISNYFMHVGATKRLNQALPGSPLPWFVGFDDLELSFALGYCRILVRQPTVELGRRAAALLLDRIRGEVGPPRPLRLATEVLVRGDQR